MVEIAVLAIVVLSIMAVNTQDVVYAGKNNGAYLAKSVKSIAIFDGYVRESEQYSSIGGQSSASGTTFVVGDDAYNRQLRAILHFDTGAVLPDNAWIAEATLKIRAQSISGRNPFLTHGILRAQMQKFFGMGKRLEIGDFQTVYSTSPKVAEFSQPSVGVWYVAKLYSISRHNISTTGTTQFRLYFTTGGDNDNIADFVRFYSGDDPNPAYHPVLEVQYQVSAP